MKTILPPLSLIIIALAVSPNVTAQGQQPRIVGYVNYNFYAGDNLFVLPVWEEGNSTLNANMRWVPDGTAISLWNPTTLSFDRTSTYNAQTKQWSENFTLLPGTGARLHASDDFLYAYVGTAHNHDGTELWFDFTPPGLFSGPDGVYLLGDKAPISASGDEFFFNVMGRLPNIGEQLTRLDGPTQKYITSTYLGAGVWDIVPVGWLGEAFFFNVGPVPEPGTAGLALLGLAAWCMVRRSKV
jgi:hypothetical protein